VIDNESDDELIINTFLNAQSDETIEDIKININIRQF
jgi:hypothetical protein